MKRSIYILIIAVVCAAIYWALDGVFEYLLFSKNLRHLLFREPLTLMQSLLTDIPPATLWKRVTFAFACLLGGGIIAAFAHRIDLRDAALRENEQQYRRLFDDAVIGIFRLSPDGRLQEVNAAFAHMVGIPEYDLPNIACREFHVRDFLATSADLTSALRLLSERKPVSRFETRLMRMDKTTFTGYVHAWPVEGRAGRVLYYEGFVEDVSERKLLEEQVRQSQKLEAIGQMAGGIAHDFNNQLSGILGYTEMMSEAVAHDPRLSKYARNVLLGVERSADLTKKLLAFARKSKQRKEMIDVNALIAETLSLLNRTVDKRIQLRSKPQPNLPRVLGDPTNLQNCLLNLALNSRDAMPEGGILTIESCTKAVHDNEITFGEAPLRAGNYVLITVSDTGFGMSADTLARIFEPFFTTKGPEKGTGMGLAALYGTIQQHSGAVTVWSAPGEGTVFTLLLPIASDETSEKIESKAKSLNRFSGRAIVVDDEPTMAAFCTEMLQGMGCEVQSYMDPAEALAAFNENAAAFDFAVIDMIMPTMTGFELLTSMRTTNAEIPAVVISGYSEDIERQKIAGEHRVSFLSKPFTRRQFHDALEQVYEPSRKSA